MDDQQATTGNDTPNRAASSADGASGSPDLSARAPGEATGGSPGPTGTNNAGGQPGSGAPKKRRRRGKRGGQRHRSAGGPKPQGEQTSSADEAGATSETTPRPPRPPRPQGQRPNQQRQRQPQRPRNESGDDAGKVTDGSPSKEQKPAAEAVSEGDAGSDSATQGSGTGQGSSANRRRRRRRSSTNKPASAVQKTATTEQGTESAGGEETPEATEPRKQLTSAELAAAGATRLAARKLREEQRKQRGRGRRPRRLSEAEAERLKGKPKTMLIHDHEDRTQIAILEEGELIEHYVSRRGQRASMVGNVYLGKVQNVIVGMEAAFVDFGRGRNGILYANEITYTDDDLEGEIPRIEKALKPGQKIMVQVTKDPIGTKGARLSTNIALAGRYLVLAPEQQAAGVSRRLSDKERIRLRKILKDIDAPAEHGVIIRTAADGASEEAIRADLGTLLKQWNEISTKAKGAKPPAALYEEPELIMRVARDVFADDFEAVVCDTREVFDDIRGYMQEAAPDLVDKVSLHEGRLPLFEERRVAEQLHKSLERKVWLPSGGSLIWERTEAMTVIDVNTGKFTGGKGTNLEDTVFKNNCEAAEEIARQLRLRDVGGIIIIDFIDMIDPKNQREVIRVLKTALSRDKTKSQVFDVSNLGLVEMTRKRVSEGLVEAFSETCPNCDGRGIIVNHRMD
jgi:ribonuclease E